MHRRLTSRVSSQVTRASELPIRTPIRRCSTQKDENVAGARLSEKITEKSAPEAKGPQRKDWRSHSEVVYVKGVPMKGSLFKLPLKEQILISTIFAITGSAAVMVVRPFIRKLALDGFLGLPEDSGWVKGPWLYRFLYVAIMFPSYSALLFAIGSVFGRRVWFSFMIHKMWSRFLPRSASNKLKYYLDIQHY